MRNVLVFFFVVRHAFAAQIFPHPSSAAARRATERKKKRRRRAVAQHPWLCCCSSLQRLGRRVPLAPEQLEEEKQLRSNWERTRAKAFSTISKRSLRRRGARGDGGVQVFAPLFPLLAAAAAAVLFFSLFCCSSSLSSSPSSPEENRAARAISFVAVVIACLNNKARPLSSRSPGLSHYLSLSVRPPHTQKKKKNSYWKKGISQEELLKVAADVEAAAWKLQADAGVALVGLDGTLYDQVLDWTFYLGLAPARFSALSGLDKYFAMARGTEGAGALDMSKFFDTNYHYMVPELDTATLTGEEEKRKRERDGVFLVWKLLFLGCAHPKRGEKKKLNRKKKWKKKKKTLLYSRHPRLLDLPRPRQARPGRHRQGRRRPHPDRAQHPCRPRQARRGHRHARQGRGRQGARPALRGGAQGAQGPGRARGADARADHGVADGQRPARGL